MTPQSDWVQDRVIPALENRDHRLRQVRQVFGIAFDEDTDEWIAAERHPPPLCVTRVFTRGHHDDPFHAEDTYYLSEEVGGSGDATIQNTETGESIRLGDMLPYLIRRACFFRGKRSLPIGPDPGLPGFEVAPVTP